MVFEWRVVARGGVCSEEPGSYSPQRSLGTTDSPVCKDRRKLKGHPQDLTKSDLLYRFLGRPSRLGTKTIGLPMSAE